MVGSGTGAGFVIMKGKHSIQHAESINIRQEASIFQAELIAIQEAVTFLNKYVRHEIYKNILRLPSSLTGTK